MEMVRIRGGDGVEVGRKAGFSPRFRLAPRANGSPLSDQDRRAWPAHNNWHAQVTAS